MNMFSQAEFDYHTTDSYSSFVSGYVVKISSWPWPSARFIFLLVASAEPVYREAYPRFLSIRRYFSWQGLRTRSFFIANVVGIALTFFFFAYQTVFYLAANKLGAWAPAEVPFSDLLNTRFPWVMVLFVGFFPAVSEEIQFRAFAIPFLRKFLKSGPLAIVLAAFIWGFLHSAYPNQPFFIRGLEVGFGGVIIGLIMLRFGILATLIWHYSVDALYTAFLLLRSPNHYLMVSGGVAAGIMLIPLIVALAAYLKTGTFAEEDNSFECRRESPAGPLPEEAAAAETPLAYQPLSPSRLILAGVLAVIFAALAFIPVYRFGKGIVLHESPQRRAAHCRQFPAAAEALTRRLTATSSGSMTTLTPRRCTTWRSENPWSKRTRFTARPPGSPCGKCVTTVPCKKRSTRFSSTLVSGEVFGFRHALEENAPGASLIADQARRDGGTGGAGARIPPGGF